jgi:hypothetical protein
MITTRFAVRKKLHRASAKVKSIAVGAFGIGDNYASGHSFTLSGHQASIGLITLSLISTAAFSVFADSAMAFTLNNGPGGGTLRVGVDGYGSFGSGFTGENNPGGIDDAFYTPIGTTNEVGTTFSSVLAIRFNNSEETDRTLLTSGTFGIEPFTSDVPPVTGTSIQGNSSFILDSPEFNLRPTQFNLEQVLTPLTDSNGNRSGTELTQTYTITNISNEEVSFELVRYSDGDLVFEDPNNGTSVNDGGGRLTGGKIETLFQTSEATDSADEPTNFVGITAEGGTIPSTNRFEVSEFPGLLARILSGSPLNDIIAADNNGNQFTDQSRDLSMALRNEFSLAPNETTTYTTRTIFGTGAPSASQPVPEPLTILGSLAAGGFGVALRRKYKSKQKHNTQV